MFTRQLGRSGIEVSAIGMGCWAIGGPNWRDGKPIGWGQVDDAESIRAIHKAIELGVTLFDTADVYGCGHSERILAQAVQGRRDRVVIATKFGHTFNEATREGTGENASPEYVRQACDASLKRLNTDYIDLYQFHLGGYDIAEGKAVRDMLDELVAAGKIRCYGWSTDCPERARLFAQSKNCVAIQQALNVLDGNAETLAVCEKYNLASLNRGPLAMGILTGKFTEDSKLPDDDIRRKWDLKGGTQADMLKRFRAIREILTAGGRTPAQGAIGWLWRRSDVTIPIPGFKTVKQVEENIASAKFGPLTEEQMREIDSLLAA
jgi:aryl-alcohol dehydrogenase-like predicted oxidoreductase